MIALYGLIGLTGCAVTPNMLLKYNPTEWSVSLAATYTISCKGKESWIESGAVHIPAFYAGIGNDNFVIRFRDFNSPISESDMSVSLTGDGRLKSLNSASTGQGEQFLNALIKTGSALLAPLALSSASAPATPSFMPQESTYRLRPDIESEPISICDVVKLYGKSDVSADFHQLSIIFTGNGAWENLKGEKGTLKPLPHQVRMVEALKKFVDLSTVFEFNIDDKDLQPVLYQDELRAGGYIEIIHQQVRRLNIVVKSAAPEGRPFDAALKYNRYVDVPLKGDSEDSTIKLRIPQPPLFGKQTFSVEFADSGKITRIGYAQAGGAVGALGAISTVAGAESTINNAEIVALRAAADLIAQQQRLARCLAVPITCS